MQVLPRDKILFVINLKSNKILLTLIRSAILHQEMKKTSKCEKLIEMTTGYFLSGGPLITSFPGPPFAKMAAELNFPPWEVQDVKFPTPWGIC